MIPTNPTLSFLPDHPITSLLLSLSLSSDHLFLLIFLSTAIVVGRPFPRPAVVVVLSASFCLLRRVHLVQQISHQEDEEQSAQHTSEGQQLKLSKSPLPLLLPSNLFLQNG